MPKLSPKVDGTYAVGEDGLAGGVIAPGTEVTVAAIVDASEDGVAGQAGDGDMVVVEWLEPAIVRGEDGPELGNVARRTSIPAGDFADLFTTTGGR